MEISDIINGVARRLDELFPSATIYTESVEQGLQTPALMIRLVNFEHIQQIGKRWKVTPMFSVQYIPERGAVECGDANLKIQQGIDDIELVNGVLMLARGARSEVIDGPNGSSIGQNFARFDFFLQRKPEFDPMLTLQHWVNGERVNNIG